MTVTSSSLPSNGPKYAPPSDTLDLRRALRAFGALMQNKEDTAQVFEIMRALNGRSVAAAYRRMMRTRGGGPQAYDREELIELLDDDAAIAAYPPGSVGAEYFAWRKAEGLSAEGLAQESNKGLENAELGYRHPYGWLGRRIRDVHDIWHILSAYGRDSLGESCLVAFSYAQTGGPGWALIAIGAALNAKQLGGGLDHWAAIWEGYQRGRKTKWLLAEDYRRILAEPVSVVRARLGVTQPRAYEAVPVERRNPQLRAA